MNKKIKSLLPKSFLVRLTFLNIIIISLFIVLSSWAIYNTACFLVEGMGTMNGTNQSQFNTTLFNYLLIFSFIAIIIGSIIHFYLTKKLIQPLKKLIHSTKSMKKGNYPKPIDVTSSDEIGQLISNFNDLVNQLKVNHEHRKKLVTDLSHELRTPLSNLNGYLYALKNGDIEGDDDLFQSLYKESDRLTKMAAQLETLKDWDYIKEQAFIEKETTDIGILINESMKMFERQLKDRKIQVNVNIEHAKINIEREGIVQACSNLIDNAIRYYVGDGPILIEGRKLENDYRVSITGPSQDIPTEKRNAIFDRFFRTDESRSRDTGGTGLGLSITKEIIEQHHGKIGYQSNGNKNTFWFRLPL